MSNTYNENNASGGNSVTLDKIESTIELLERVHRIELKDIRQFILENQTGVLDSFNNLVPSSSIDSKFNTMDGIFSNLPNYQKYSHYMLEMAVLVR